MQKLEPKAMAALRALSIAIHPLTAEQVREGSRGSLKGSNTAGVLRRLMDRALVVRYLGSGKRANEETTWTITKAGRRAYAEQLERDNAFADKMRKVGHG